MMGNVRIGVFVSVCLYDSQYHKAHHIFMRPEWGAYLQDVFYVKLASPTSDPTDMVLQAFQTNLQHYIIVLGLGEMESPMRPMDLTNYMPQRIESLQYIVGRTNYKLLLKWLRRCVNG